MTVTEFVPRKARDRFSTFHKEAISVPEEAVVEERICNHQIECWDIGAYYIDSNLYVNGKANCTECGELLVEIKCKTMHIEDPDGLEKAFNQLMAKMMPVMKAKSQEQLEVQRTCQHKFELVTASSGVGLPRVDIGASICKRCGLLRDEKAVTQPSPQERRFFRMAVSMFQKNASKPVPMNEIMLGMGCFDSETIQALWEQERYREMISPINRWLEDLNSQGFMQLRLIDGAPHLEVNQLGINIVARCG